jgi:hypothetical protein
MSTTSGNIERSYATGDVDSSSHAGGLVGYARAGTIRDSYSLGNVNASSSTGNAGGFVGKLNGADIVDCYSFGETDQTTSNTYSGAFLGVLTAGTIATSYGNRSVNSAFPPVGEGSSSGATRIYESAFANQTSFVGWDFTNVWIMGAARPELR